MELKILGGVIIVAVFATYGFYLSYKVIYRQNDLLEMKRAILVLSSEIKFLSTSIIEAIQHIENTVNEPIRNVFSYFKFLLEQNSCENIEKLWEKSLNYELKMSYFNKNDIDKFKIIGSSICNYDKELTLNSFRLVIDYIDQSVTEINLEKKQSLKMYQSLSILIGVMVVILLV